VVQINNNFIFNMMFSLFFIFIAFSILFDRFYSNEISSISNAQDILVSLPRIPQSNENDHRALTNNDLSHHHSDHRKGVKVKVFHYLLGHWGPNWPTGDVTCDKHIKCEWIVSDQLKHLQSAVEHSWSLHHMSHHSMITVGLYNIHSLWEKYRDLKPQVCSLSSVNLTMYETEESVVRFNWYFNNANPHFDGYSSTHPNATVQRVYLDAFLNETLFHPLKNFTSLIKGGAYIASDCHRHDGANSNRDGIVRMLRGEGVRVDGLGRCMRTENVPEGEHVFLNPVSVSFVHPCVLARLFFPL
jgi:hypothetical protein